MGGRSNLVAPASEPLLVAVIGTPRAWLALAAAAATPSFPARVIGVTSWPAAQAIATLVDAAVVVHPGGHVDAATVCAVNQPAFAAFLREYSRVPIVVVLPTAAAPSRAAYQAVGGRGVVIRSLSGEAVWAALRRATAGALLLETARSIVGADHLPPRLRQVLAQACVGAGAMTSVQVCAALAGCHRRTLWRDWQRAGPPEAAPALEDVLGWILVLRARAAYRRGASWTQVASHLGVDRATLTRTIARTTGIPLREFAWYPHSALAHAFHAVVAPLVTAPSSRMGRRD